MHTFPVVTSYYRVCNLLPGPFTICRLHEGNHIALTYTTSWIREEDRAVIYKRPTERRRDEIEIICALRHTSRTSAVSFRCSHAGGRVRRDHDPREDRLLARWEPYALLTRDKMRRPG